MTTTLEKALSIISREVDKLDQLSKYSQNEEGNAAYTLDRDASNMLVNYVKTLVSVNQEWREQAKSDDLATRTDEELNALALEALAHLEVEKPKKKPKKEPAAKKPKKPKGVKTDGSKT